MNSEQMQNHTMLTRDQIGPLIRQHLSQSAEITTDGTLVLTMSLSSQVSVEILDSLSGHQAIRILITPSG